MKYKLVQNVDGNFVISETDDIIAAAEVRGFSVVGYANHPRLRAELQGEPIFSGLCGPMWDGGKILYEDAKSNDILSA